MRISKLYTTIKNRSSEGICFSFVTFLILVVLSCNQKTVPSRNSSNEYYLVWSDEFNREGRPDSTKWNYENGFVRNEELQWYQPENARCKNGLLVIEAKREQKTNPLFREGSNDWRRKRKTIEYTSSCLITKGKNAWQYGRFEMRGKIDTRDGIWPAWWTLGVDKRWPANGEIDIMEYYRKKLMANIAFLDKVQKVESLALVSSYSSHD